MRNGEKTIKGLSEEAAGQIVNNMTTIRQAIDKQFGEGYAEQHPELLGSMLIATAHEYTANINLRTSKELHEKIKVLTQVIENKELV